MQLILLPSGRRTQTTKYHFTWLHLFLLGVAILFFATLLAGVIIYSHFSYQQGLQKQVLQQVQDTVIAQQHLIGQLQHDAEHGLQALAKIQGQIDSDMKQLEAVASDLVKRSGRENSHELVKQKTLSSELIQQRDVFQNIDTARQFTQAMQHRLSLFSKVLGRQHLQDSTAKLLRPVRVNEAWQTSGYGERIDPITKKLKHHNGVDYGGFVGTDILAAGAGVVIRSEYVSDYGNVIDIYHGGNMVTRYAHNDVNKVQSGDIVDKGQVIATMGNTGRSTGVHVHFEILVAGAQKDPTPYVVERARAPRRVQQASPRQ